MISLLQPESVIYVAPLAGAWIEIVGVGVEVSDTAVAPLAGAWIEMFPDACYFCTLFCRSPRGSVD